MVFPSDTGESLLQNEEEEGEGVSWIGDVSSPNPPSASDTNAGPTSQSNNINGNNQPQPILPQQPTLSPAEVRIPKCRYLLFYLPLKIRNVLYWYIPEPQFSGKRVLAYFSVILKSTGKPSFAGL